MEFSQQIGGIEIRREGSGSVKLAGKFPYRSRAIMGAGGNGRRPQKEEFAPRAFSFAVDDPQREIHLLVGHSFDRPLASKLTNSLTLIDSDDALTFSADISPEIQRTSYWTDFFAGFAAGLIVGLSPGFRVPPKETVSDAEEVVEEDPAEGNALIRIINQAVLFEISLVTRPAYSETEVEARALAEAAAGNPFNYMRRWRA